jgi:hypothetical protein
LATDRVQPSRQPETWNIGGFVAVSVVLGVVMVAEALFALWIGWTRFGLVSSNEALYTFSFLTLLYFAVFSIVSARERRRWWATMPSPALGMALALDALVGTLLTTLDLPGLQPLPAWQSLVIFGYAMVSCLVLNDAIKVTLLQRWGPERAT